MANKRSSDQTGSVPKKPPKRPTRDYSNLPQRPITLKHAVKRKSSGKTTKNRSGTQRPTSPRKKTTPQVKQQPSDQWLLKGISDSLRQHAREEAERQGLSLEAWLTRLILNHLEPVNNEQDDKISDAYTVADLEQIAESLHAIEQRLERIEEQRGFWSRFWEQVMNQSKQD
jgi:hypothetical protein